MSSIDEEENRKDKNLCLYSELIKGEWKFCCNNKIHDPIISKRIFICDKHINLLNKKYQMDIKEEIVRKYNDFKKNNIYNSEDLLYSPFIKSIFNNLKINFLDYYHLISIQKNVDSLIYIFLLDYQLNDLIN